MTIVTFECDVKFRDGRKRCGLAADYAGDARQLGAGCDEPTLLIWHGGYGPKLKLFLNAASNRYVLMIGTSIANVSDDTPPGREFPLRLRSFKLAHVKYWQEHPEWKRKALENFCKATKDQNEGAPPWKLLGPPLVPEHVLACYFCALAGVDPEEAWATGFKDEVDQALDARNVSTRLDWTKDRKNREMLREFLVSVGPLAKTSAGQAIDA